MPVLLQTVCRHPEKIAYEWDPVQASNHSAISVIANGYPALFFAEQARQNDRTFPDPNSESAALIYNFAPTYTAPKISTEFDQCYFFPPVQAGAKVTYEDIGRA